MKTKDIKYPLLTLALMAVFFSGCPAALNPPEVQTGEREPFTPGTGLVRILLDGEGQAARTLLPAEIPEAEYVRYDLEFTGLSLDPVNIDNWNKGSPVILAAAASWNLSITAYVSDGSEGFLEAARGGTETPFTVTNGGNSSVNVTMCPIIEEGTGTFAWDINYPDEAATVFITLQPLPSGAAETLYLKTSGAEQVEENPGSKSIAAGYYRVTTVLNNGLRSKTRTDVMHIYKEHTTTALFVFPADYFVPPVVTSNLNSGPGTFRDAIEKAGSGDTILVELPPGSVIDLNGSLNINKDLIIDGNGITLTGGSNRGILSISGGEVTLRRIHFKDGEAGETFNEGWGAAIHNLGNSLVLESCIFSGNRSYGQADPFFDIVRGARGGAIYSRNTLIVRGCTFYNNTSQYLGGAIYNDRGVATLTGNIFFGNRALNGWVVYNDTSSDADTYPEGTKTISGGYNQTDTVQSGFSSTTGDTTASTPPVSLFNFKPLPGSSVIDQIGLIPAEYPLYDFYGVSMSTAPLATGAVQTAITVATGYWLDYIPIGQGSVSFAVDSDLYNEDGFFSHGSAVILEAAPNLGSDFKFWLLDGVRQPAQSPPERFSLTMDDNKTLRAVFSKNVTVSSLADSGTGTLREALSNAGDYDVILVDPSLSGGTIALTSALPQITRSLVIEGSGVTLTRAASWTTVNLTSQLLYINSSTANVTIRRVHFKNGLARDNGAAVRNTGTLILESCVFSGNKVDSHYGAGGGAVCSNNTLTIRGCTFYRNTATDLIGGAVVFLASGKTLTLTGNLFYGNTASSCPVVYKYGLPISASHNVVDIASGTGDAECGWVYTSTDVQASVGLPVSPQSFRLLAGSNAVNRLPATLPADYPAEDFYGQPINGGGAAGAVQAVTLADHSWLDLSANYSQRGYLTASPAPDGDSLVPNGSVTITATANAGYTFRYWLVDGVLDSETTNTLVLTISDHTRVQAVFALSVDVFNDTAGSDTTPGTLRYALANVLDGETIYFSSSVTPGATVIELASPLPELTKSITIEGEGVILTASWTTGSNNTQLLRITGGSAVVTIRRVHFKNGLATDYGGTIYNNGALTLESCIFSGNRTTNMSSSNNGGAIWSNNTLTIRGCTFYENVGTWGKVVYFDGSALAIEGNLFYGNTTTAPVTSWGKVVVLDGGTLTASYNVVDTPLGTGFWDSGWTGGTGDVYATVLPLSPKTFRLLGGSPAVNKLTALPVGYPSTDFYGQTISVGGAAGAVQAQVANPSGYYLDFSVNNSLRGSVSASPEPDADGIVPGGSVAFTASPNSRHSINWLEEGVITSTATYYSLTVNAHNQRIQAVFTPIVNIFSDSNATLGTLRYALTNAQDGDIIRFSEVTPGTTAIELESPLPELTKSVTIEGAGITLTRTDSWTASNTSQLLRIGGGTEVTIRRIHFKNGLADGDGGAVYNNGTLTVESCIFSGNTNTRESGSIISMGGGINSYNDLTIRGCTFYGNYGSYGGGVVLNIPSPVLPSYLTLTGNLFYGNTSRKGMYNQNRRPVCNSSETINASHNVVDVDFGGGDYQCGWTAGTGDKTTLADSDDLTISGIPFNTTTFVPVSALQSPGVLPATAPADFPLTDFYGTVRTFPGAPGAVAAAP